MSSIGFKNRIGGHHGLLLHRKNAVMAKMMVIADSVARRGTGLSIVPNPHGKKLMTNAIKGETSRLTMMLYPNSSMLSNPPLGYNDITMQNPGRKAMRIMLRATLKGR